MLPRKYHNIVAKQLRQTNWENGCYFLPLFFLLFPFISQFVSILGHPYLGVKHVVRRLSLVSKDRAIGLFIFAEVIKS